MMRSSVFIIWFSTATTSGDHALRYTLVALAASAVCLFSSRQAANTATLVGRSLETDSPVRIAVIVWHLIAILVLISLLIVATDDEWILTQILAGIGIAAEIWLAKYWWSDRRRR